MLRKILLGLTGLLVTMLVAVAIWGPAYIARNLNPISGTQDDWPVSAEASAFHQQLVIGDWHADSLLWDRDLLKRSDIGHTDIPRLAAGNVAVQVFTTVTKSPSGQNYSENSAEAFDTITPLVIGQLRPLRTWTSLRERALDQAARLNKMAASAPDQLMVIRSKADLVTVLDNQSAGGSLVGGLLGSEGAHPLEGDLDNLDRFYDAGFRLMGLTHFFDNELGGSLHGQGGQDSGLTDFGRQVVTRMVEKQMIIDLAHASPQIVRDVLQMQGTRPVLSHTGIHGNCETPRNLDDGLMKAIADKGGLVGMGYWQDVVCGKTPDDIAASIVAAVSLLGEDAVSLGSDYDGSVDAPFDAEHLSALTHALLMTDLTKAQIAKVMGGNMMAYLAEMLPQ